jgi:transcriptional regulator with PAS, ATPase and Fis domain
MLPSEPLNSRDLYFFKLISKAIFANPFSDEQIEVELKISHLSKNSTREERINKIINLVSKRLETLEKNGQKKIQDFAEKDQNLIKYVYIFDLFYRYRKNFDQIILDQMRSETSIKITFSTEALNLLKNRGFSKSESVYYFAIAYQLRRAFYFIDHNLIGCSQIMKKLRLDLWNNVFTHNIDLYARFLWNRMEDFSTLILGETGTGKGTAAIAIGRSGFIPFNEEKQIFVESYTESFVSLNLSQFPESLIESELFGHKKGAFTGAVDDYEGVFNRCSPYGSILLDEIGDVSIQVQIKLLQVLQERTFSPVGSHIKGRFQGRVIAATNRSIEEILKRGIFRNDFYYRLCSDIITVPALRVRIQDNPKELSDLLKLIVERILGTPSPELTQMVEDTILSQLGVNYSWPGNVRELEQSVRRILLKGMYQGDKKTNLKNSSNSFADKFFNGDFDANKLLSEYCKLHYEKLGTYESVSKLTNLDRRTVKKYILSN